MPQGASEGVPLPTSWVTYSSLTVILTQKIIPDLITTCLPLGPVAARCGRPLGKAAVRAGASKRPASWPTEWLMSGFN